MNQRNQSRSLVISQVPLAVEDHVNYNNQRVKCARCTAIMEHAPYPTNSTELKHRPRCGRCGSMFTYPSADQPGSEFPRGDDPRCAYPYPKDN